MYEVQGMRKELCSEAKVWDWIDSCKYDLSL